jgi:hypothetical protein
MATQATEVSINLFIHRAKAMATQAVTAVQYEVFSRPDPTAKYNTK